MQCKTGPQRAGPNTAALGELASLSGPTDRLLHPPPSRDPGHLDQPALATSPETGGRGQRRLQLRMDRDHPGIAPLVTLAGIRLPMLMSGEPRLPLAGLSPLSRRVGQVTRKHAPSQRSRARESIRPRGPGVSGGEAAARPTLPGTSGLHRPRGQVQSRGA